MQIKIYFILALLSCNCFANSIFAEITNNIKSPTTVASRNSLATVSNNIIFPSNTEKLTVKFNSTGTRAILDFTDLETKQVIKTLLVVIDGPFSISTAVCVPISACSANNPSINANHDTLYFKLN